MQATPLLVLSLVLPSAVPASAQAPSYTEATVGCARFAETVRGTLQSAFGEVRRTETVGRDGVLVVRAAADHAGLAIEAWYDSLAVFRDGPEGRFSPGAEGILGGRYSGTLDPDGEYLSDAVPFVPVALRDIFDFSRILLHFFPPLPPREIPPGGEWSDDAGLTIWRLADSATAAGPVSRYRWIRRAGWDEGVAVGDSTVIVHRSETEQGTLRWRDGDGPVGWGTTTEAGVEFVNGAGRSTLAVQSTVRRTSGSCR